MTQKYNSSKLFSLTISVALFFFLSCGDNDNGMPDVTITLPEISVGDISIERTSVDEMGSFYITLNKTYTEDVSVQYEFVDGTAQKGKDYSADGGTLIIPANNLSKSIEIKIFGNKVREENRQFTIVLKNPSKCTLKKSIGIFTIVAENGTELSTSDIGYFSTSTYPNKQLIWSDEFDGNTLNDNFWNYEIGNGVGGWGNNELEYYTNNTKNIFISNGNLIIEARKEQILGYPYSSARITTKNKKEFTFGRIDIRAKLPKGKGVWPALWMLGANISSVGWPTCGEIDIMELIGSSPSEIHGTLHWKGIDGHTSKGQNYFLQLGDFSQEFHVFSLEWKEDTLTWMIDGKSYLTISKSEFGAAVYPFNADQFVIFNVAVGGNWPGSPDESTTFPQRMFVDYIRVFQ